MITAGENIAMQCAYVQWCEAMWTCATQRGNLAVERAKQHQLLTENGARQRRAGHFVRPSGAIPEVPKICHVPQASSLRASISRRDSLRSSRTIDVSDSCDLHATQASHIGPLSGWGVYRWRRLPGCQPVCKATESKGGRRPRIVLRRSQPMCSRCPASVGPQWRGPPPRPSPER